MEEFNAIIASDFAEIEKLAQAFAWVTGRIIERAHEEIELAQTMHDEETVIKEQIKMSTLKHAREVFEFCYIRATGRRPWDE
jgi:hypothetical protein